jgi:predicted porin
MKKTLIALAVLGATAGVAHAQSNVTVYGIVDTGFVKETGSKVYMNEKVNNRLGFRGVEDLGGGLKATFELEKRFNLFNGATRGGAGEEFDGASNVGLAGSFGAVRFGRVNELSTETYRTLDPFNQYGVGGGFESPLRSARISSTTRYDSPSFAGFSAGVSYTLKNQTGASSDVVFPATAAGAAAALLAGEGAASNDGYAVSLKYLNGPIVALANYNRAANTNDSYNWNVGGAYSFGPAKVSLGYEKTNVSPVGAADVEVKALLVGLSYNIGAGTINASYNQAKVEDAKDKQYALGYTHNLSKRTAAYLDVARLTPDAGDKVNAVQIGMTHKF